MDDFESFSDIDEFSADISDDVSDEDIVFDALTEEDLGKDISFSDVTDAEQTSISEQIEQLEKIRNTLVDSGNDTDQKVLSLY